MFKYNGLIFACVLIAIGFRQGNADEVDPTRPLGYGGQLNVITGPEQESIVLSSILMGQDRKVAIVNGQVLHEGQVVKGIGAQVKKIDADAVTLQQGGKVWRVPLNQTVIRK